MKKKLFLLPILAMSLSACGSQPTQADVLPKETVTLTQKNFSTYVAVNTTCTPFEGRSYALYYSYFIGADECKFIDCTVTYKYTGTNDSEKTFTVPLSLSGDGQAIPFVGGMNVGTTHCTLSVTNAKGTVEVYR